MPIFFSSHLSVRGKPLPDKSEQGLRGYLIIYINLHYFLFILKAYFLLGPALRTSGGTPSLNFLKFSINKEANCLYFSR